jgi:cytochrome P450
MRTGGRCRLSWIRIQCISDLKKSGAWRPTSPIVEVDPPEHRKVRRTMRRIFSPERVQNMLPRHRAINNLRTLDWSPLRMA